MDYYQQGQSDESVKEKLSQAAQFLSQSLVLRQPDPQEMRQPTEYEKALDLAFCFGSPETLAQALRVTDEQIFSQPDPRNAELYRSNLMYCQILRHYLSGEPLNLSAVRETLARCEQDNAWKFDRFNTFQKLKILESIHAQDQVSFNKSLSLLAEDHKNEAQHGDLQRLPDANMCLPALLLVKLGKLKAGLACSVKSPYLPVHLVS